MTFLATIKVPAAVRDELRDAARAAHLTQGQLIKELLAESKKTQFWAEIEAETPDKAYLNELIKADSAFVADAEADISRFESDQ